MGGWHTGAEIGAYNEKGFGDNGILKSASFSLTDANGNVITSRTLDGKYWVNSFVKGNGTGKTNGANGNPSSMSMFATLEFNNSDDAASYFNAIESGDRSNRFFPSANGNGNYEIRNPSLNGSTVSFELQ